MRIFKTITLALIIGCVFHFKSAFAEEDFECHGFSTVIYANSKNSIAVCHSRHMKVKKSLIKIWQDCTDAMIYIRNKTTGMSKILSDCIPISHKQFKIEENDLFIKHYHNEYPGFELKPLLVEKYNIINKSKTYSLIAALKSYTKEEVVSAISKLDNEVKKPFNGSTYFENVYNGFFILRNFAQTDPQFALKKLKGYVTSEQFSGEVSEVLSDVVREAKLISLTVNEK